MRTLFFVIIISVFMNEIQAQHATVYFNYENTSFNENQALPAEKFLMIRGSASSQTIMVEVNLLEGKNQNTTYTALWKRPFADSSSDYIIPFNHKFRSNEEVDLAFFFYRAATKEEKNNLKLQLTNSMDAYVDQVYKLSKKKIALTSGSNQIIKDLNQIIDDGMFQFNTKNEFGFDGFSKLVTLKLEQIEKVKLKKSKLLFQNEDKNQGKNEYRTAIIQELKDILHNEIQPVMNQELLVISDTKFVQNYPVEKTRTTISLTAGYTGVFFGKTNGTDLDYGQSPSVGISIPFANKNFKKKFWGNLNADFGVLLMNMTDANGETISGPIIKRPLYAGLSYRFLKFLKIQAGYTLLEYQGTGGQFLNTQNIAARPFVGVGVQFDFWMDFSK